LDRVDGYGSFLGAVISEKCDLEKEGALIMSSVMRDVFLAEYLLDFI